METYLVYVVEDLVVTAVLAGIVYAYARSEWGGFGTRVTLIGAGVAVVCSIIMALLKQNTALIATGDWNAVIFALTLILCLVALVSVVLNNVRGKGAPKSAKATAAEALEDAEGEEAPAKRKLLPEGASKTKLAVLFSFVGIMALRIFYKLPDVLNYPANFGISADQFISSDFAMRIIGWLLGIVIAGVVCVAASKAFKALEGRHLGLATGIIVGIVGFVESMSLFQLLIARRIITKGTIFYSILFPTTSWVSNHAAVFTLGAIIVTIVLAAIVIALSLRDNEAYSNPAEHRKIKARWRNRRRWSICLIVCLVFSFFTVTVVKSIAFAGPELAESEECDIREDGMYISLDQVDDGHLHRFTFETTAGYTTSTGYETQGGVGVRVIVIKKPNSNAYGVGLDACDICGTTGYYERDGQVVCNKCDVVMNINTIGFKGGCNPLVIDYKIADGYIFIATDTLLEYEKIPGSSW